MARLPRINLAGGLFHVIQRGNNREPIFLSEEDYHAFLDRLARFLPQLGCRLHAYCLMGNHLHVLLETRHANLSRVGQRLFASYTLWFNRHHRRVGHVLQGRFKSFLVEQDAYLVQLSRYIHLNPVKARLVRKPEQYRWSSMRNYLPTGRHDPWVHTATTLAYFHGNRQRYVAYVYEGLKETFEPRPIAQAYLGSEAFVEKMEAQRERNTEQPDDQHDRTASTRLVEKLSKACAVPVTALQHKYVKNRQTAEAKALVAYTLRQRTTLTFRQIGQVLGEISGPAAAQRVRVVEQTPRLRARAARLLETYDN